MKTGNIISLETDGLKLLGLWMCCGKNNGQSRGIMSRLLNLDYSQELLDYVLTDHDFVYVSDVGLYEMLSEDRQKDQGTIVHRSPELTLKSLPKLYRAMSDGTVKVDDVALSRSLSESVLRYQNEGISDSLFRALCSLSDGYFTGLWSQGGTFRSGKRSGRSGLP